MADHGDMDYGQIAQGVFATALTSVLIGGFTSLFVTSRGLRRSIVSDKAVGEALPQGQNRSPVLQELAAEMEWKAAVLVGRSRFPVLSATEVMAYVFGVSVTLAMPTAPHCRAESIVQP
jgi:hypothetical protein